MLVIELDDELLLEREPFESCFWGGARCWLELRVGARIASSSAAASVSSSRRVSMVFLDLVRLL